MKIRGVGLEKAYRGRKVVRGVTFQMDQGEIVGLLGPNGAGKTTTFYMTVGLVRPNAGKVFLGDEEVTAWPMYKRARAGIGYLPQEASVFRRLSVRDNLRLVLELRKVPKAQREERVQQLAEELHITKILDSTGNVLSGGERRRVEIARALACDPKFILLDEPFAGIDPKTIEEIQSILLTLRDRGIGILVTDHNVGATLRITDYNFIINDGEIFAEGSSREIASNALVRKYYLGESFSLDPLAEVRERLVDSDPEDLTE
ncbi:MAG: LPS export ABC transporter ATP-binding protein [Armatimonadetes bacterium]|nr:LPS export ABC transporter ATP-binding protein [Armatimonadota bacterium]